MAFVMIPTYKIGTYYEFGKSNHNHSLIIRYQQVLIFYLIASSLLFDVPKSFMVWGG